MTQPAPRLVRCRYLGRNDNRCQNEVAEEGAEIDLCVKHLTDAANLISRRLYRWATN